MWIFAGLIILVIIIWLFIVNKKQALCNGFPCNPKENDTFVKNGRVYTYRCRGEFSQYGDIFEYIVDPGPRCGWSTTRQDIII